MNQVYKELFDKTFIAETLSIVHNILTDEGITHWLDYGTLLGAYRDGKIIEWDHDIDIGIERIGKEKIAVITNKLIKEGLHVEHITSYNSLQFIRGDLKIDISMYDKIGDIYERKWGIHSKLFGRLLDVVIQKLYRVYIKYGTHVLKSRVPAKYFNKLDGMSFMGVEWNIPAEVEEYLKLHYGKDWRIPKRKYDYENDDGTIMR